MKPTFFDRHQNLKDLIGIGLFITAVVVGTIFINSFIFRSFNVVGPSMEKTLYTGDRLIVNRVPSTMAGLKNQSYVPHRGEIIVFENPQYTPGSDNEYIVKRVIALPGEDIELKDGKFTVYNDQNPNGFNPDDFNHGLPGSPTSGELERKTVPPGTIFVSGDHRQGNFSSDSRNGLGYIPLTNVIGKVEFRIWPLNKINGF